VYLIQCWRRVFGIAVVRYDHDWIAKQFRRLWEQVNQDHKPYDISMSQHISVVIYISSDMLILYIYLLGKNYHSNRSQSPSGKENFNWFWPSWLTHSPSGVLVPKDKLFGFPIFAHYHYLAFQSSHTIIIWFFPIFAHYYYLAFQSSHTIIIWLSNLRTLLLFGFPIFAHYYYLAFQSLHTIIIWLSNLRTLLLFNVLVIIWECKGIFFLIYQSYQYFILMQVLV
jgi:hypothetical protein